MSRKFPEWTPFMKKHHGRTIAHIARDLKVRDIGPPYSGPNRYKIAMSSACSYGWGFQDKGKFLRKATPCEWTRDHELLLMKQVAPPIRVVMTYDSP